MAQRAGKALREKWAAQAYADRPCPRCRHAMGWHARVIEKPATGSIVNGEVVIREAVWGGVACHADGCDCKAPPPGVS